MFNLALSALVGVLAAKIFDGGKRQKKPLIIYIFVIIVVVFLAIIYEMLGKLKNVPAFYERISLLIAGFENNILLQGFVCVVLIISIVYVDAQDSKVLPFEKYSKKIIEFTKRAQENSIIKIAAGDMDFFGSTEFKNAKSAQLMDNSPEYKQLLELQKNLNGLKLEILCSHGLDKEPELFHAIVNNSTTPKLLYSKYRNENRLANSTFQQLLRIGRIKKDFRSSVEIHFYSETNQDRGFRARFVDNAGIVYRKEVEHSKKTFIRKSSFPFVARVTTSENLYSINNLNEQEYAYYEEMFSLKWKSCDINICQKIVSFCEALYRFVTNNAPRFHMALVYVNSYEIARKGKRRKEFPPFGVMYLAACVRQNPDWDVKLISVDNNTTPKELESWVNYDVIGLSIISSYSYDILKHCYNASHKKIDVVTIVGGYQAEIFVNNVFQDFDADIIFKGEGENNIQKFCEHYEDRNYAAIEGIIYRGTDKNIYATTGSLCVDIDKIPFPARDLLPEEDVVMTDRLAGTELRMVHMLFSRGCIYNCFYCAAGQDNRIREIRYRNKFKIVEELQMLKNLYSIDGFSIIDDCFLTDQEKAIEICDYIADQNLNLKWSLAARVDSINDEVLTALRKSGCIEIKFGVETGSDLLLKKMNKGETVKQAEDAIRMTKNYGINVKLFIITGLPFESNDTHRQTKEFLDKMYLDKLVDRISLLRFTPLAGSYIYSQPDQFEVNKSSLGSKNFSKVSLYRKSSDWWTDKTRFKDCERWYKDMRKFIDERWSDA
ncbi:B12-binding domain-containing radical SAM protein [Merdimonas faecis]|uniref:B12-binding domain-containing radical SAM protein n=1 Tax=Merdimonas faecis TaxID=1653435 RepID=UPI0008637D50|nr:radical SAM protein [Merdimonas faecis]